MQVKLRALADIPVLSGALNGRTMLGKLLELAAAEPAQPEPLFLDFAGVYVATSVYLRESVMALRDIIRGRHSMLYPVIANANETVREELLEVLKSRGSAVMACALSGEGEVTQAVPLGELDPKQGVTFKIVHEGGLTDAADLMRKYGAAEGIKQTAWNNRLAALAALGLVVELSEGRAKRYRPLFAPTS
jgi:hypothetical protein